MKSKLSNKIPIAIKSIPDNYISHILSETWGNAILIMEKEGKAFGRIYWYHDDNPTVYLDNLSVEYKFRKQGLGTKLQKIRENIGICLGANTSCLWVKKDVWMYEWYKRREYIDFQNYSDEENAIWMKKSLIKI